MRRGKLGLGATLAICAALLCGVLGVSSASAADFGLNGFDVTATNKDGTPATQAGSHPYAVTIDFNVDYTGAPFSSEAFPNEEAKDFLVEMFEGFAGNPAATPRCSTIDFLTLSKTQTLAGSCPSNTAVGVMAASLIGPGIYVPAAVYNLETAPGVAARLGFRVLGVPLVVDVGVGDQPPYTVTSVTANISQVLRVFGSQLVLWGNPNDSSHDLLRGDCIAFEFGFVEPFYGSDGNCPTENAPRSFLTLPRSCTGPLVTSYEADSWQSPGEWIGGSVLTHDNGEPPAPQGFTGCEKVPFNPVIAVEPTSASAESGTGLDVNLDFNQEGLVSEDGLSQSEIKRAVVTLPVGVTVNPSVGEGLGVCSKADYERESLHVEEGEGCPNSSKIGTVSVETPALENPIKGSLYLAQQDDPGTTEPGAENPFDSLIALYIVLRSPEYGISVKIPAKVEPDPKTGQLVTTVEDIPQLPFNHFNLHFREGQRASLVTPPTCASYDTVAKLTPWSDPSSTLTAISTFKITGGIDQGPCPPGGIPPFHPDFEAGSINNNAKAFSPFDMRLIRHDGEQDMTKFGSILPPGVLGKLAGVSECPDAAIANAASKTGRQEFASPSCPANSQIGRTLVGAGVGPALTYVPGKIYLGGPYKGDPLSVVSVTPAVAGPFDAGDVVVRIALTLNPETAEVEVDGASSDPIPHILKGIPLKVRDVRVYVDRHDFILNPTSCDPSSAKATLFGSYLNVFDPADDVPVGLSTRYQAANCLNLPFKPKLSLKLKGGTRRGDHPALKAVLNANPGDANIGNAVVTLSRSSFLDQAHIRTICTRVQFAAKACPKGAEYGYARAWTPLLDNPVEGPVYLRSSNHKLPDLVASLHGLVDVNVVGRIDSKNGAIRSSFETIPDAPVTKFILTMQGGKKGLVVNSRNLCAAKSRANAQFTGQNGIPHDFHPLVKAKCRGK
jgi:hypothetical protein